MMDKLNDTIYRKDAILFVDVYCYKCGKLMALSNATVIDGRYYCPKWGGN